MGLNTRLDQIIRDPCFTKEINFGNSNEEKSAQLDILLDRFCLDILPTIDYRIRWLKVSSTSMKRLLLAADYPNLSQLDIFIPQEESLRHFNGKETVAFSSAGPCVHHSCEIKPKEHQWSSAASRRLLGEQHSFS